MTVRAALVRLSKWKVDDIRRKLLSLASAKAAAVRESAQLETDVMREQELAARTPGGEVLYPGYAQGVIAKRQLLSRQMDELDDLMDQVRAQVNAAYRELKKYEISEEQHQSRVRLDKTRRAQRDLDEISSTRTVLTRRGGVS